AGGQGYAVGGRPRPAGGGAEPLVGQEGPVLGAAAAGAGGRGGLRPHGERPAVPAHGPVPPLAPGPHPSQLHLRAAGGAGAVRPRGDPGRPVTPGRPRASGSGRRTIEPGQGRMTTLTAPSCLRWNM